MEFTLSIHRFFNFLYDRVYFTNSRDCCSILAVAINLCAGITAQEQLDHEGFPKYKRTHFRIRLIVK